MLGSFYIIHPKPRRTFRHPFFVAYGRWLGTPGELRGILSDRQGNPVAIGRLLRNTRRYWVMAFADIPVGSHYRLEIRKSGTEEACTADALSVEAGTHSIQIDYPTDDDLPVGSTFITYGTTDVGSALSADLTPDGGGTVTYLWGPPDTMIYWAFEFDDVEVGAYTLTVSGESSYTRQTVDVA